MSDWTWADWTIAVLGLSFIILALLRAPRIRDRNLRQQWRDTIRQHSRERGER